MTNGQHLSLYLNLISFSDATVTNNPKLRNFDYHRNLEGVSGPKPRTQQHTVSSGEAQAVASLQRSLTTGASWTISNPTGVTSRLTWSGVNPVLRTERTGSALTTSSTIQFQRQASSQVVRLTFSQSPGSGIAVNDEMFIGDTLGANPLNQGIFKVVAVSGLQVDILSPDMVDETITVLDTAAVYFYSPGPVRTGDFLRVSNAAFNFGNRGDFTVERVTSRFIEVSNSQMVPEGPITADVVVYESLYKFTYIEVDQPVKVTINGGTAIDVEPFGVGLPGIYMVRGPVFSVDIQNSGYEDAHVTTFFTA